LSSGAERTLENRDPDVQHMAPRQPPVGALPRRVGNRPSLVKDARSELSSFAHRRLHSRIHSYIALPVAGLVEVSGRMTTNQRCSSALLVIMKLYLPVKATQVAVLGF
jgi:hypothetical protein